MRTIVLLMALMLLTGCKITRKVVEEERKEWNVDSVQTVASGSHVSTDIDWVTKDSTWWRKVGKVTIYDTSVTNADGSHPVKVVIETTTEGGSAKEGALDVSVEKRDTLSQYTEVHNQGETESIKKSNTKVGMSWVSQTWLWLLLVIALLLIYIKVWKR